MNLKLFLSLSLLIMIPFNVLAARQTGKVTGLVPFEAGGKKILVFNIENNIAQGCNTTGRFAIDQSKLNYDLMASTILSAFYSNTTIQVEYSDSCNAWGNSYDAVYICIGNIPC